MPQDARPSDWELDTYGRPLWIAAFPDADCAPWGVVIPRSDLVGDMRATESALLAEQVLADGPGAMPAVHAGLTNYLGLYPPPEGAPGRPTLDRAGPLAAKWAAWMYDVRDVSINELGRRLVEIRSREGRKKTSDERNQKRLAERRLEAGRRILHREGVLPWFLFSDGSLPSGWWSTVGFSEGLRFWHRAYVDAMPGVIAALRELRRTEGSLESLRGVEAALATAAISAPSFEAIFRASREELDQKLERLREQRDAEQKRDLGDH